MGKEEKKEICFVYFVKLLVGLFGYFDWWSCEGYGVFEGVFFEKVFV